MCTLLTTSSSVFCGPTLVGLALFLLNHLCPVDNLNIDTQFPVHFDYPGQLTQDSPHFGHSVLIVNNSKSNQFIFLIGAPNENVELLHTGSIYRCEWRQKLDRTSCQRAPVSYDFRSSPTKNMHLGFNLVAQPRYEQYLSCAYSRTTEHNLFSKTLNRYETFWHPNGACYQFRLDQAKPLSSVMPMNDESHQFIMQNSTPVYFYSHAMAGFSSAFSKDGNRLFLGAPGYDNWKGALLEITHKNNGRFDQMGKFIHNIVNSKPLRDEFAYLGYSMAIGRFFDDQNVEYAVLGAPRVAFVGSVAFLRLDRSSAHSEAEQPWLQLNGNQSGEYFGSSLLVVDLNSDGFDDLLVGAPMYCSFRKGFSDEGRVFVYLSNGKSMTHQTTLYGQAKSDARFGTSMASLGDINHDGFNDIVIGAPYENGGKGAIYIYRGARNGLASNFSQRVSAVEIPVLRLSGFGYSFSSQIDVDGNGFNDLLVGSYLSNSAILLRSRPIIRLQAFMKITDDYIDLNQTCSLLDETESRVIPASSACIGLQFCFNTANFDGSYRASLRATLRVDSETNERCFVLLDNGQKMSSYVSTTIVVHKQAEPICSKQYTVVMKEEAKIDNYIDPIVFSLSYDLEHPKLDRTNIYQVPIVEGAMTNITTETYIKICESTAKSCVSLLQLKAFVVLNDEEEVAVSEEGIELIEGLHHKAKLQIVTINMGDPAFDTKVNVTLNSTLSLISLDKRCQLFNIELPSNVNSTSIECALESPLHGNSQLDLVFNPFETYKPIQFRLEVRVANQLHPNSHLVENFVFNRVKRANINLNILESPELIRYKSESGNVSFDSILEMERLNYSTIDLLELYFIYPASHNQHLFATSFLITNLNNRIPLKCEPEKTFSFESSNEANFRQIDILTVENGYKSLNLTCANSKMTCKAVKCRVGPLTWQALSSYVKFSSRLMVGLIENHFGHYMYSQIVFTVRVVATIVDAHLSSVSGTTSVKNVQFVFKPVEPISDEPVPKWPYIIGALIGLLIIILLIVLLWKCGFFKRGTAQLEEEEDEKKPEEDG